MNFKFSKDSVDSQQETPGEKKKQSSLLVLLLVLVGGFTYIYFFTDLIKPQEEQKTAEAPAPAPQVVKMPLPPHGGEPAKPVGKPSEKAEAPEGAVPAPAATAAPPAKPAQASAAKPATAQSKPKEEPKKAEAPKPADKKPQPVAVADKKVAKVAAKVEEKKPATADKKSTTAKEGNKKQEPIVKAKKTTSDTWSLIAGNYVLEEALSADMGRVRKAGFEPVVKPSARKKSAMNRLLVSEFNDHASAQAALEKLKRHTSDAFVIEQGGKFNVYAGSYLQSESATSEKERLKAAGFTVTIKHTEIAIPSQSLTFGPFKNKKDAVDALGKLKSAGIKVTLSQK